MCGGDAVSCQITLTTCYTPTAECNSVFEHWSAFGKVTGKSGIFLVAQFFGPWCKYGFNLLCYQKVAAAFAKDMFLYLYKVISYKPLSSKLIYR